jgi:hypothetical protein
MTIKYCSALNTILASLERDLLIDICHSQDPSDLRANLNQLLQNPTKLKTLLIKAKKKVRSTGKYFSQRTRLTRDLLDRLLSKNGKCCAELRHILFIAYANNLEDLLINSPYVIGRKKGNDTALRNSIRDIFINHPEIFAPKLPKKAELNNLLSLDLLNMMWEVGLDIEEYPSTDQLVGLTFKNPVTGDFEAIKPHFFLTFDWYATMCNPSKWFGSERKLRMSLDLYGREFLPVWLACQNDQTIKDLLDREVLILVANGDIAINIKYLKKGQSLWKMVDKKCVKNRYTGEQYAVFFTPDLNLKKRYTQHGFTYSSYGFLNQLIEECPELSKLTQRIAA